MLLDVRLADATFRFRRHVRDLPDGCCPRCAVPLAHAGLITWGYSETGVRAELDPLGTGTPIPVTEAERDADAPPARVQGEAIHPTSVCCGSCRAELVEGHERVEDETASLTVSLAEDSP